MPAPFETDSVRIHMMAPADWEARVTAWGARFGLKRSEAIRAAVDYAMRACPDGLPAPPPARAA